MVLSSRKGRAFQYLEHSVLLWRDHHWRDRHSEVPNVLSYQECSPSDWFLESSGCPWISCFYCLNFKGFPDHRMDCMSTGICLLQCVYLNIVQNGPALLILEIFLTETLRAGRQGFTRQVLRKFLNFTLSSSQRFHNMILNLEGITLLLASLFHG